MALLLISRQPLIFHYLCLKLLVYKDSLAFESTLCARSYHACFPVKFSVVMNNFDLLGPTLTYLHDFQNCVKSMLSRNGSQI